MKRPALSHSKARSNKKCNSSISRRLSQHHFALSIQYTQYIINIEVAKKKRYKGESIDSLKDHSFEKMVREAGVPELELKRAEEWATKEIEKYDQKNISKIKRLPYTIPIIQRNENNIYTCNHCLATGSKSYNKTCGTHVCIF